MRHIKIEERKDYRGRTAIDHVFVAEDAADHMKVVMQGVRNFKPHDLQNERRRIRHFADINYFEYERDYKKSWLGRDDLNSWDDLDQAIKGEWAEGVATVRAMQDELAKVELPTPRSMRRRPTWTPDSGDFDLDRFRGGDDCWRSTRKREALGQQFVTVIADVGGNCNVSPENLFWRGVACIVLADALEQQGYCAEVVAYTYNSCPFIRPHDRESVTTVVKVKEGSQPCNVAEMANVMSPWFFRLATFALWSLVGGREVESCKGSMRLLPAELEKYVTPDTERYRVDKVYNKESALKFIVDKLTRLSEEKKWDGEDEESRLQKMEF